MTDSSWEDSDCCERSIPAPLNIPSKRIEQLIGKTMDDVEYREKKLEAIVMYLDEVLLPLLDQARKGK